MQHRVYFYVIIPKNDFKTQFESYGKTDGERIDNIECKIHELLLEDIKKNYHPSEKIIQFIDDNYHKLISGKVNATFAGEIGAPYCALRGYNPNALRQVIFLIY